MNPENIQPNLEQHLPSVERPISKETLEREIATESGVEAGAIAVEMQPQSNPSDSPIVLPSSLPTPIADDTNSNTRFTSLGISDDDKIEETWIMAAKQIVEQTKDDPHKQNQEVDNLKSDYKKKKYGEGSGVQGQAVK
ncbi:hypothetical protein HGB24_00330 [Candidatus Saccharibacteria bacterium]|nr:hypothetical protein [Candidatus Saccharibacteria bacterium]